MKIRAGVTSEVQDLVAFIAERTDSPAPENALYVALHEPGSGEMIGCLIFYSPFKDGTERGVKFGGALVPGKTWGSDLRIFIGMREMIEWVVFDMFKADFLQADVRLCNTAIAGFLRSAGFAPVAEFADYASFRYSP